jgi:hypothetical protein
MPTTPPTISPFPTPPSSSDPGNFDSRADAFLGQFPSFQSQANALGTNVYNNAQEANTSATNAANSASAANTSATNSANSATASSVSATSASNSASAANTSATNANTARVAAENARDQALSAGADLLVGTSVSSLVLSAGSKSLTTQTNKSFVPGQYLIIYRTSDTNTFMQGTVASYDKSTGSLVVNADYVSPGSGTFSDWSIGLLGMRGYSGERPTMLISANTVAVPGNNYAFTAVCTLTMPPSPQPNDVIGLSNASNTTGPMIDFGTFKVKTKTPGVVTMLGVNDSAVLQWSNNTTIGYIQVG